MTKWEREEEEEKKVRGRNDISFWTAVELFMTLRFLRSGVSYALFLGAGLDSLFLPCC